MGPSPTYHPPEGEECETSVEHGLPLWAEPAVGYCSRRPRPPPMWGSRFVGAREVGPWVGEQKPLGKSSLRGNPSPESTYLPTCTVRTPPGHHLQRSTTPTLTAPSAAPSPTPSPAPPTAVARQHRQPPAASTLSTTTDATPATTDPRTAEGNNPTPETTGTTRTTIRPNTSHEWHARNRRPPKRRRRPAPTAKTPTP